jgi:pilus assembly protein Flp/PilA
VVREQIFMRRFLLQLWCDDTAATAVEYAVLLALILIAVMGAIGAVAQQTGGMWGNVKSELDANGFGS